MKKKVKWYQSGLAFSCHQCGNCCSGPGEGYVWVTREEIDAIADYLKMAPEAFRKQYVRRVGAKLSLIERKPGNDCIFLQRNEKGAGCGIYPVRPQQCRTWPFWPENLRSPDTWNRAATTCPGMNKGRLYPFEEIETIRKGNEPTDPGQAQGVAGEFQPALDWIADHLDDPACLAAMDSLYNRLETTTAGAGGICEQSGRCCRFADFDHRLYVTTLEMFYFVAGMREQAGGEGLPEIKESDEQSCPYQESRLCTVRPVRPGGCRIFFCQGISATGMSDVTEDLLADLRRLHRAHQAPYLYQDWLRWLAVYRQWLSHREKTRLPVSCGSDRG